MKLTLKRKSSSRSQSKDRPELSEKIGVQVGIVEAIAGISNCEVTIEGNADHAGATGMFERGDALAAMAEVVAGVEAAGREHALNTDGTAVATVGELSVEPDVRNIVPGEATARLELRDVTDEGIHALVERVRQVVERVDSERPVDATMEHYRHDGASVLSERCIGAAERAAVEAAVSTMRLHSAGVHDTALVSDVTDAALLFAPSVDGISHNPREWTDWEDCAAATQVLARTLVELAGQNLRIKDNNSPTLIGFDYIVGSVSVDHKYCPEGLCICRGMALDSPWSASH